ncbi:hypothetical protein [Streptomyces lydicus]|uniref:hypothetical protein n=1 Tax=Streptomyces lydicus TaxID=47763 RepID=UPI0037AE5893
MLLPIPSPHPGAETTPTIEAIHGKGGFVRAVPAAVVTTERAVTRTGKTFASR